jgi:hypothetical protein
MSQFVEEHRFLLIVVVLWLLVTLIGTFSGHQQNVNDEMDYVDICRIKFEQLSQDDCEWLYERAK